MILQLLICQLKSIQTIQDVENFKFTWNHSLKYIKKIRNKMKKNKIEAEKDQQG